MPFKMGLEVKLISRLPEHRLDFTAEQSVRMIEHCPEIK
jgi:hypothetical protein